MPRNRGLYTGASLRSAPATQGPDPEVFDGARPTSRPGIWRVTSCGFVGSSLSGPSSGPSAPWTWHRPRPSRSTRKCAWVRMLLLKESRDISSATARIARFYSTEFQIVQLSQRLATDNSRQLRRDVRQLSARNQVSPDLRNGQSPGRPALGRGCSNPLDSPQPAGDHAQPLAIYAPGNLESCDHRGHHLQAALRHHAGESERLIDSETPFQRDSASTARLSRALRDSRNQHLTELSPLPSKGKLEGVPLGPDRFRTPLNPPSVRGEARNGRRSKADRATLRGRTGLTRPFRPAILAGVDLPSSKRSRP